MTGFAPRFLSNIAKKPTMTIDRYANRQGVNKERGRAFDPDIPEAGCYRIKQGKETVPSVVRIWLGPPVDPATGEEVPERGERWQAAINGEAVPLDRVWPGCARSPISQAEHDRLLAELLTMDPESPFYDPRKSVDLLTAQLPF